MESEIDAWVPSADQKNYKLYYGEVNEVLEVNINHPPRMMEYHRRRLMSDFESINANEILLVLTIPHTLELKRRNIDKVFIRLKNVLTNFLRNLTRNTYDIYHLDNEIFVVRLYTGRRKNKIERWVSDIISILEKDIRKLVGFNFGFSIITSFKTDEENVIDLIYNLAEYSLESKEIVYFDKSTESKITRKFLIKDSIEQAIYNREIDIALQPLVDSKNRQVSSYEALARWNHPVLGNILPSEFISVAERRGLIDDLGVLVLEKCCEFLISLSCEQRNEMRVNINVSVLQLQNDGFIVDIGSILNEYELSPRLITLEITESYLLDCSCTMIKCLNDLKKQGFGISLDDVGSGLTSITSLFRLPLTQIKFSRDLVNEAIRSSACFELISLLCRYSKNKGVETVAEGIEHDDTIENLLFTGIDTLQGFAISRPLSPEFILKNIN
ncbi:TPA: EAL domain-containing protein [Vibrio parahaemolyticus]|nr:EAL domain-containing protein [Vibrio parahaemolyticus]